MAKPNVHFDGEAFYAPFEKPEYPEITAEYLPSNVHVHFDFGRHLTRGDFEPTLPKFSACDIYIPEAAGHTERWEQITRRVSRGDDKLYKQLKMNTEYDNDTFEAAEFEAIFASHKPIIFIDASSEETTNAYEDDNNLNARIASGFISPDEAIAYMYEQDYRTAYDEANRDRIMLENLGPKICGLLNRNPRLEAKDEVFVLMRLGATHYPVYTHLAQSPYTATHVSAETVSYRMLTTILSRIEDKVKLLIEDNQKIPRHTILAHSVSFAMEDLMPLTTSEPEQLTQEIAIRNIITNTLLASGAEEAALLVGRFAHGEETIDDRRLIEKHYADAKRQVVFVKGS